MTWSVVIVAKYPMKKLRSNIKIQIRNIQIRYCLDLFFGLFLYFIILRPELHVSSVIWNPSFSIGRGGV
jgi:hypothetical protein